MKKVVFWCQAGSGIGYGHVARSLVLANELNRRDEVSVVFVLDSDDPATARRINQAGFPVVSLPQLASEPVAMVILDLASSQLISNFEQIRRTVLEAGKLSQNLVWIDSIEEEALANFSLGKFRAVVSPYLGAENGVRPNCDTWLAGARFAIVSGEASLALSARRPASGRLLISMGGADPKFLSEVVLEAATTIEAKIRLVAGPFFPSDRVATIRNRWPEVELVENRIDLWSDFSESDILVTTVGLTRYEAAAAGIPTLIISDGVRFRSYLDGYQRAGLAKVLFMEEDTDVSRIRSAIQQLFEENSSCKSRSLIDGHGARRVIEGLLAGL